VLASSASSGVTSNDATATVVYCDNIAIYMTVNFFLNIAILAGPLFIGFECVL